MLHDAMNMARPRPIRAIVTLALALMLAALPFAGITTAKADGGLNLSTPYPGVSVNPGENVTFTLSLENESATPQNVELSFDSELSGGWKAYFEGDGNRVSRVYVDDVNSDNNIVSVDLMVDIPDDAAAGTQTIVVKAKGEGMSATLRLDITVSEEEFTSGKLACSYPEKQGSSSTTFDFSVTLTNNSSKAQSYALSATPPDSSWQVEFANSEGTQLSNLNVEGGRSQTITVTVDPPTDVDAKTYTIPFSAVSTNEPLSVDLTVVITGTYYMTLSTPSGNLSVDAVAGQKSTVTLTIENTGTADLNDVSLTTYSAPTDWTVEYDTDTIGTLAAGQSVEVIAYITPATDAVNGDYVVTVKAANDQVVSNASFRVTVKTSTVWGIVGIVIVAAVVVALIFIFRKFGRR